MLFNFKEEDFFISDHVLNSKAEKEGLSPKEMKSKLLKAQMNKKASSNDCYLGLTPQKREEIVRFFREKYFLEKMQQDELIELYRCIEFSVENWSFNWDKFYKHLSLRNRNLNPQLSKLHSSIKPLVEKAA